MKILALFVDIPDMNVMALSIKCEKFISRCQSEENFDENEIKEQEEEE
jgi:hypothetical protein